MRRISERFRSHWRAFTLIELLVVIAIIAILVALLLPAVQQVREAARKAQCQDHLHNVAVAIMDYESSHKTLPLNFDPRANFLAATEIGAAVSWIYMTLPFLEQKPLYDAINIHGTWQTDGDGRGLTVAANIPYMITPIDVMMCPSNPQAPFYTDVGNDGSSTTYSHDANSRRMQAARTDYSGNMGWVWTGWKDCGGATGGANGAPWVDPNVHIKHTSVVRLGGAFWWRGTTSVSDYTDGLSNTVIVNENHHWRDSGRFPAEINKGYAWASPVGAVHAIHAPINDNPSWNDDTRCSMWSSTHPGGAQAVAGDAKVFFGSENMDLGVMRAIVTRSGGESKPLP